MRPIVAVALALAAASAVSCAEQSTAIPPSHGSAAAEERAAREHERAAGVLEKQAQARDGSEMTRCGGIVDGITNPVCYSDRRLITKEGELAAQQRHEAAEHRRVSQALRDAETRACDGVPEADRVESPFAHWADILSVQILPDGAMFQFRSVNGLSASWLKHLVDCQLARDDALGHDVPEMAYCPLVPRGAMARVAEWSGGYLVEVRSADKDGAAEIIRRAQTIASARP